ncbi:MAG TPA: gliding motility protein GldN [Prolixibacteraceae bacterium]|nr:gliding motility protein GldN [Prolixibacteraceae bacterium]
MKSIVKTLMLVLLPVLGFSQQGGSVRFTDKFGPFYSTYQQENDFAKRKAIAYPYVREADVMWSKVAWEIIDLREKMNLPLYYPLDTIHGRKSLIMAVTEGIKNGSLFAFKPQFKNNAFEFDQNNIIIPDSLAALDENVMQYSGGTIDQRWLPDEITQILVKEVWYFDRKSSQLNCEIIGLCFIREYDKITGAPTASGFPMDRRMNYLFWIYYPDAREYLATIPVYNPTNDTELYSFDDLFVNRKFKANFVREANVYNDRLITDYLSGREAQLESDRIKKEIFDYEQDLWEN